MAFQSCTLTLLLAAFLLPPAAHAREAVSNSWAFDHEIALDDEPLVDLRAFNEEQAGATGFVRLTEDGNGYARGDGRPLRFWGVAANVGEKVSDEDLRAHAKFLARMGCNAVRIGGASPGLIPREEGTPLEEPNRQFVEDVWRTVAIMKEQGIYTRIAPFWDHGSVKYISPDWGLEGYHSGDSLNGLLFFEPTLREAWKNWMRVLMTEPNPHTGIPLKDEPAVNLVQIVSEDSLLFYFTDRIKGGPRRLLEEKFGQFAATKYGGYDAALDAWGENLEGDLPEEGRLALLPMFTLTTAGSKRTDDQAEFLATLERHFYEESVRFLRDELDVKAFVNASNFGPADKVTMGALQHWTWAAADVTEFNAFYNVPHEGPGKAWKIEPGHFFANRSAFDDWDLPNLRKMTAGRPFHMSSTTWLMPNRYTVEGPLFQATYGALLGIDGVYNFAANAPTYQNPVTMPWTGEPGERAMHRWGLMHPGYLSQFPAVSVMFRQGLIAEGDVVVKEVFSMDEMVSRAAPLIAEDSGYQPTGNNEAFPEAKGNAAGRVSPDAFLVGPVVAHYDGDPAATQVRDLTEFIDRESDQVRSVTRQLTADRKRRLLLVDAPAAQGVGGFLAQAGGSFELSTLTVESRDDYAIILAVALDGLPLSESQRVLVQCGVPGRLSGWETKPETREIGGEQVVGEVIMKTGELPWQMEAISTSIALENPALTHATALDSSLRAKAAVEVQSTGEAIHLQLPAHTLHTLLTSEPPTE